MSTRVKINEHGMAELERQISAKIDRAMQSVVKRDAGNKQPDVVLKHLHEALAAEGVTPNDDGLRPQAVRIAEGDGTQR